MVLFVAGRISDNKTYFKALLQHSLKKWTDFFFFPESISKACDAITGVYTCCNLLDIITRGEKNEK